MKLTLIAKIRDPIAKFFSKDSRFFFTRGIISHSFYIENNGLEEDGFLQLDFGFESEVLEFDFVDFYVAGLLIDQLNLLIRELVEEINNGNLEKLPELADTVTCLREQIKQECDKN